MSDSPDDRTKYAEDRTVMANERTFAGWLRTGLASLGLGVGFHVLFRATDPTLVAKAMATTFIIGGILIFWAAQREAAKVFSRLHHHMAEPPRATKIRFIAGIYSAAGVILIVAIWMLR